jgi:hypothetical protein
MFKNKYLEKMKEILEKTCLLRFGLPADYRPQGHPSTIPLKSLKIRKGSIL